MTDKVEKSEDEDLIEEIRACYKEAKKHSANWRVEAVENYDFRDGRQWSAEDTATLEEQERPIVTFNRMGPYFDAVSGSEINNRQEIKFLPRTLDDGQQNETLNAAVKWVRDTTNAEDEESDAFGDVLCTGMGWIETRMDYDDDPDGKVVMERVDPLEAYWDPTAKKRNLQDAKWLQRVKWLSEEQIEAKWPDLEIGTATTPWGDENEIKSEPHNASLAFLYRENSADGYDEKSGKYRVVQHLYYDMETFYRVLDQQSGKIVTLSAEKFKLAKEMYGELSSVKQKKKVYKYVFVVGDQVAEKGELKCGFNIKAITGKRDQNTNTWYGLARVMKDPQRWANKFLAQIMHTVNSNAKGGLLAEAGAFKDIRKAEEKWTDSSAIIEMNAGGIQKIKEREQTNYPAGLDKLLQFAVSSIPQVTGVNPEFLGAADRQQAGILEQERKKSSFIILAGFFDALALYRKEEGRLLAHFIKEYLNDGRIIRITTEQGQQSIPLNLSDENIEYDVVVSQSPSSPNLKEDTWATLGQLIPQMLKAGVPIPPEILLYSPLPESVARAFMQKMSGQLPPQAQQQMQQMQQQLQQLGQENHDLKQQAQIKMAQLQSKHELGQGQNAVAADATMKKFQAEMMKEQQKAKQELDKLHAQIVCDMQKNGGFNEAAAKLKMEEWKAKLEAQTKITVAQIAKEASLKQSDDVDTGPTVQDVLDHLAQAIDGINGQIGQKFDAINENIHGMQTVRLKKVRDKAGRMTGVIQVKANGSEFLVES